MGMLDYCALKGRILVTTAALVAAGSSLCYTVGGWPATEPFLAGGCGGLLYQKLLQVGVDSLPGGAYSRVSSFAFFVPRRDPCRSCCSALPRTSLPGALCMLEQLTGDLLIACLPNPHSSQANAQTRGWIAGWYGVKDIYRAF